MGYYLALFVPWFWQPLRLSRLHLERDDVPDEKY
jgi:hypothetical protein